MYKSRVVGAENTLLGSNPLSTIIGIANGKASCGFSCSQDHKQVSDQSDRINLPRTIIGRVNKLFKMVGRIYKVELTLQDGAIAATYNKSM